MDEKNILAAEFEANRAHLKRVAYRMLGSTAEAEDAVQEAWLRLARTDTGDVGNLAGWLTTVVARICLDMLRSRKARREDAGEMPEIAEDASAERDRMLADSIGIALLVVLETLTPAERVAFVLHDMFDLPFDDIAPIVDRTPDAARQLASRARRRVQGASPDGQRDRERQREVVEAFLTASRGGDLTALLAVLDPNVVLRADAAAITMASARAAQSGMSLTPETRGASAVAETFKGRAAAARLAVVDGLAGAVFALNGKPMVVFGFTVENGKITAIDLIADQREIRGMELDITP